MTDERAEQQREYQRGLDRIHAAITRELERLGVGAYSVDYTTVGSRPVDTAFTVNANGRSEEVVFTREEISDAPAQIHPETRGKIRALTERLLG